MSDKLQFVVQGWYRSSTDSADDTDSLYGGLRTVFEEILSNRRNLRMIDPGLNDKLKFIGL